MSLSRRGAAWVWGLVALALLLFFINGAKFVAHRRLQDAEGGTRGQLGRVRGAMEEYLKSHGGALPPSVKDLEGLRTPPPTLWIGNEGARASVPHEPTIESIDVLSLAGTDSGKWAVVTSTSDKDHGMVFIDCTHTDSKGSRWDSY
ncbi:MAG TPA: hypothetical protein DD417_11915 [Elusimicrobia bacterium]|nr:hypothetical protein [Elusimicrobiota bacterium]